MPHNQSFDPFVAQRGVLQGQQIGRGIQQQQQFGLGLQQQKDTARFNSVFQGATALKQIPPHRKADFLRDRIAQGVDPIEAQEALKLAEAGRFEELEDFTDQIIDAGRKAQGKDLGRIQQATAFPGGFVTLSRQGQIGLQQLPPEDLAIVEDALEREAERKAQAAGLKKKATEEERVKTAAERFAEQERGKSVEARRQGIITLGLDGARGIPILRRSMELLQTLETGGVHAAALRIKQFFGIESDDEGELAAGLGKAVLSQLRPIFGSQFTEREGDRLNRLEAGFRKSPATNRRLLGNFLQLVEREANRAIKSAVDARDFTTAAEIQELLDFELEADGGQPIQLRPSQPEEVPARRIKFDAQGNIIQ